MEEFFMGEKNFHEGALDFPALFELQSEIKLKKVFFNESKE